MGHSVQLVVMVTLVWWVAALVVQGVGVEEPSPMTPEMGIRIHSEGQIGE